MATRMQQRRGTAQQWTTANPILNVAEIGYETDTNKFKIGDGTNHWADLTYFVDAGELASIVDGAPALLDTLNELAAAIGDDPAFMTTVATNLSNHQSDTTNIHGIANTADLATQSYVDTAVENIDLSPYSTLTGAETLTNKTLTDPTINVTVGLLPAEVNLEHLTGISSAVQGQLDSKASATDLSDHSSDTTSVHGIADTSLLATITGTQTLSNKTLESPIITVPGPNTTTLIASPDNVNVGSPTPIFGDGGTLGLDSSKAYFKSFNQYIPLNENTYFVPVQIGDILTISFAIDAYAINGSYQIIDKLSVGDETYLVINNPINDPINGYGAFGPWGQNFDPFPSAANNSLYPWSINRVSSSTSTISSTEISYLDGVTSAIQTQLNAKLASADAYTDSDAVNAINTALISGGGIEYVANTGFQVDTDIIATKAYADGIASGLDIKSSVQVASTANIENLSTFDYSMTAIDGVYLNPGERVLLKNQTSPSENGIFIAQTPSGLVRPTDATFDSSTGAGTLTKGSFTFVEHGTHAGHGFVVSELSVSLGVWYNNWTQFSDAAAYITSVGDNLAVVNGLLSLGTDVVITDSTQTLSNKTLENPTLTLSYDVEGLPVSFTVDAEELSHLNGVTSPIQTQLDDKAPLDSPTFTGTVDLTGATVTGLPEAGPTAVEIIMGVY